MSFTDRPAPSETLATTGAPAPLLPARGGRSLRSKASIVLREMAAQYWRLGGDSPGLDLNRLHAIKLHTKALKLEAGILDDDL